MNARISRVETRTIRMPLRRPWGPDIHDFTIIEVTVTADDGVVGYGFSWTPSIGGSAVRAFIDDDLRPLVVGRQADPGIWQTVWEHIHEAVYGGITTIALAGIDIALWDMAGRRASLGLTEMLGRRCDRQPTYGSGINLHYSADELADQVHRWVAAGHAAVKVKVGRPNLAEDEARVRIVRDIIGVDRQLMLDANQHWDLATATIACERLAAFDPTWIEEPLRADDLASHVELRARISTPIAVGENLSTWYRFRDFIDNEAVDIVQPDVLRVGGITPFLRIAELAAERGVQLAPHLFPELSAQLAFAIPEVTWVEDVEDASFEQSGVLRHSSGVIFENGWATGGPSAGIGIQFAT